MNRLALVGRPNVGKSTLFNRLTRSRRAIVTDEAGTTRDRQYGHCEWCGREFSVIDTGGWVLDSDDIFEGEINRQVQLAIEEVKSAMEGMLSPEIKENVTATLEVLQTFHISKVGTIAGCVVREGKIKRQNKVRVIRDGIVIFTGDLASLKHGKDDVKEMGVNQECGVSIRSYNDLVEGDLLESFEQVEVAKKLE